jgi:acid phosphatase (class A)
VKAQRLLSVAPPFRLLGPLLFVYLLGLSSGQTIATRGYYIDSSQVDLVHVLPPPPAFDSLQGKADLQEVVAAGQRRTKKEIENALADMEESVFRFADVMGPEFNPERLPFAANFFPSPLLKCRWRISCSKASF